MYLGYVPDSELTVRPFQLDLVRMIRDGQLSIWFKSQRPVRGPELVFSVFSVSRHEVKGPDTIMGLF